ncbi:hypothetical protein [Massilia psychrophila]|nr:hypothetical protein [Massilia psychrophila]
MKRLHTKPPALFLATFLSALLAVPVSPAQLARRAPRRRSSSVA